MKLEKRETGERDEISQIAKLEKNAKLENAMKFPKSRNWKNAKLENAMKLPKS